MDSAPLQGAGAAETGGAAQHSMWGQPFASQYPSFGPAPFGAVPPPLHYSSGPCAGPEAQAASQLGATAQDLAAGQGPPEGNMEAAHGACPAMSAGQDVEPQAWQTGLVQQQCYEWLTGLDGGHGSLLCYFDAVRSEFDADLSQLAACKLLQPNGDGPLGMVDPAVFEVLGVESLEHRNLLAMGISQL